MARILTSVALFLMAITFSATAVYGWLELGSFWAGFGAAWFAVLSLAGLGRQADKDRAAALVSQQLKDNPGLPVDLISALAGQLLQDTTRSGDAKRRPRE